MNPPSELDKWDPMLEAFTSGKKYEDGPGADLQRAHGPENGKKETESVIVIGNLPPGITIEGIRNLCLGAGTPFSINTCQNNKTAFVKFRTIKEAELALRDLSNRPPYFLRVSFARQTPEKKIIEANKSKTSDGLNENNAVLEDWKYNLYQCPASDTNNLKERLWRKLDIKVSPYFPVRSEFDDPSLAMRQRQLDFQTEKKCISMGRGYINMGDLDRYKPGNAVFSIKTNNWKDDESDIRNCKMCGSITYWKYRENNDNYCCNHCQDYSTSQSTMAGHSDSSIFDSFTPGQLCSIETLSETQDIRLSCCVVLEEDSKSYSRIKKLRERSRDIISAKQGDKAIAYNDDGQPLRCTVLSNEDSVYKVALIDYGEVTSVKEVYAMPDDVKAVPSLGGVATFIGERCGNLNSVKFRVKRRKPFCSWLCDVISRDTGDIVGEVVLERWSPPAGLTHVPLESGCSVVISTFKDMKTVFVRRTDQPWNEEFTQFSNDLAAYCLEANKYRKLPKYGEVCSARFKQDGCYYRAVVRAVKRQSVTVAFMDYGNEQETKLEDLCYLPIAGRQVHCYAVRVRLKNVPQGSSPESVDYFNRLTANGTELTLSFEGDNLGEVVLEEKSSGDVVNKMVADLMVPIWEKDSSVFSKLGDVLSLESLEEVALTPGQTEDIFLLNFDVDEFTACGSFWATQNRSDYLCHLNGELKQMITEYCSYLTDDPYLSRKGELCLVELDGEWHRGVSLEDRDTLCKVFLIDSGITASVETKSTRKMLKEFLEMPALALECRMSGYEKLNADQKLEVVRYMKRMDKKLIKGVKVLRKADGVYYLSLAFVDAMLG